MLKAAGATVDDTVAGNRDTAERIATVTVAAAGVRRCWVASDGDEAIGVLDEPGDVDGRHPLRAELGQVVVGRPTGDRASLSDVDRNVVLAGLGEQVP